jgi:Flp pilus assembly protein TadG
VVLVTGRERRVRTESGAVAILVAVLSTALFAGAALVVDLGFARDTSRQAQVAADAASLAAGNVLYGDGNVPKFAEAVAAAKRFAADNFDVTEADWAGCTDGAALRHRPSTTPCISFQSSASPSRDVSKPDTVRVRIPVREVRTSFGVVAGVSSIPVASDAEAALELDIQPTCVLCVLGAGPHDLQTGQIEVTGGDIHFNGSISFNSDVGSITGSTHVEGTASATGTYSPAPPVTGQPAVTDPLAFLPMPDWTTVTAKSSTANPCVEGPGRYGSHAFSTSCTLPPGLYVIAGSSAVWNTSGTTAVTGVGVTLYFTCGTAAVPTACSPTIDDGSTLDMSGASSLALSAPTDGPLEGLAVVLDRNNDRTLRLVGSGGPAIIGTVYAPSAKLRVSGNACLGSFESMIVVETIELTGSPACLSSDYGLGTNVDLPPESLRLSR